MSQRTQKALIVAGFALSLAVVRSSVAQSAADWPMFRGDPQLTGVARSPLPDKPALLWTFETPEPIESTAAIVEDTVYVGSDDGKLYALDLATGKQKWAYATDEVAFRSSPTVADGRVFAGDEDGVMHALDAKTGKQIWSFETDAEIISSVQVVDGKAVFGSYDGHLYALAVDDGKLAWKVQAEDRIHGTPCVLNGFAIITGCDGVLRRVRITDGEQVETIPIDSYTGASAAAHGDRVYFGTFDNQVLGVDLKAQKILWRYEDKDHEFPFLSSAAIGDDLIYIGGRDKFLHALEPDTGKARWTFRTKGRIDGSPVLVGSRVFVGSGDGNLYALDAATGKQLWVYEIGEAVYASPAVGRGRLVIGAEDGVVYCFGEKQADQ